VKDLYKNNQSAGLTFEDSQKGLPSEVQAKMALLPHEETRPAVQANPIMADRATPAAPATNPNPALVTPKVDAAPSAPQTSEAITNTLLSESAPGSVRDENVEDLVYNLGLTGPQVKNLQAHYDDYSIATLRKDLHEGEEGSLRHEQAEIITQTTVDLPTNLKKPYTLLTEEQAASPPSGGTAKKEEVTDADLERRAKQARIDATKLATSIPQETYTLG